MHKTIGLVLIAIFALSSFMIVKPVNSEIITPSVPEFSLKLVDSSYDVPPASTTNPYTGQITTSAGSHVEARTVEIRIKNEDFTPYIAQDGSDTWNIDYFYNVRFKGPYETDWCTLFNPYDGFLSMDYDAHYTVLSYNCGYSPIDGLNFRGVTIPVDATVEFQVEALIGCIHHVYTTPSDPWGKYTFEGQTSEWSGTQTITIDANGSTMAPSSSPLPSSSTPTASSSQNQTVTPIQPISGNSLLFGLDWIGLAIVGLLGVIAVLMIFVVIYLRKKCSA